MDAGNGEPTPSSSRRTAWYSVITYAALLLAAGYIGMGQGLIAREAGTSSSLARIFTGTPRVVQSSELLRLQFNRGVKSVELIYGQPLEGQHVALSSSAANVTAHWDVDAPRVLRFTSTASSSLVTPPEGEVHGTGTFLKLEARMGRAFYDDRPATRQLTEVFIDEQRVSPYEFLQHVVDRDRSNFYMYYPLALANISSEIAYRFGSILLYTIMGTLMSLALSQLLLMVVTWRWRPETVKRYLAGKMQAGTVPLVDRLASELAIPLGLFGTIVGIWLALEQPGMSHASFGEVLSILRFALFSTVVGIGTRVLCRLRGSWSEEVFR